jgi:hypothetical protein
LDQNLISLILLKKMKKIVLSTLVILFSIVTLLYLLACTSPPQYSVNKAPITSEQIMGMDEYAAISGHRRPFVYEIQSTSGGKVCVVGIDHTKDVSDPQLDTIRKVWAGLNPTVALVEGRLGFYIPAIHNPIVKFGEGGLVSELSRKSGVRIYSWEPTRNDELNIMIAKFPAEKLAMFYALRPYFSNLRFGKPSNPEQGLQEYIDDRTDYDLIRGYITSWEQIDKNWQHDFPNEKDWRDYSDEVGWPRGYLFDIWNESNLARDVHMCNTVVDLVAKGEVVFVTMGSSHAPRIESALRVAIGKRN